MIKGSIVALVTPMTDSGAISYEDIDRLIDFHLKNDTKAIVAVGTTGESATLMYEEHQKVLSFIISKVGGQIPVIAGTGSNSTTEAVELTQYAHKIGADACLLLTPYYNRPTQEGLFLHYQTIAKAVPMPQILYNVPSRTACDLLPETVKRLSKIDNIIGIKEATGSTERAREILSFCHDHFCLYSGDDQLGFELVKMGALGCISVTANVFPKAVSKMYDDVLNNKINDAYLLNQALTKMHEALFWESNPIPVKYLLNKMGMLQNVLRLPLTPLSESYQQSIESIYQEVNQCLKI